MSPSSAAVTAQIYARQGVNLDRSTPGGLGRPRDLEPALVHERLLVKLRQMPSLFADEMSQRIRAEAPSTLSAGRAKSFLSDSCAQGDAADPPVNRRSGANILPSNLPRKLLQSFCRHSSFCSGVGSKKLQRLGGEGAAAAGPVRAAGGAGADGAVRQPGSNSAASPQRHAFPIRMPPLLADP